MAVYRGERTIDGVQVTVDGRRLEERTDVKVCSANGFEWSYEGPEPRQLALALLCDHLRDPKKALPLVEDFMLSVVANFDNEWEMTSDDIEVALTALRGAARLGDA